MTRPDKWDEIADEIRERSWSEERFCYAPQWETIAQALRDAEKAGMERAAVICEEKARHHGWNYHLPSVGGELATAIRAAKETKE